jgi:hypothetical protein
MMNNNKKLFVPDVTVITFSELVAKKLSYLSCSSHRSDAIIGFPVFMD